MSETRKAFVIMPFAKEFTDIFDQVIRPALEEAGYETTRADNSLDQESILRKIIKGISSADLVVADLTTTNPNVFYELGICHGLNIPTILLTQAIDDVPFDLRSYQLNPYSVRFDEINELKKTLSNIGMKHQSGQIHFGNPVTDFSELQKITTQDNQDVLVPGNFSSEPAVAEVEDAGFLDYLIEGIEASKDIQSYLATFNQNTESMTTRINEHTSKLQKLNQNPGPGDLSQRHRIIRESARDLNSYSDSIEENLHGFVDRTNEFTVKFTEVVNWAKTKAISQDQGTADQLREVTTSLRESTHQAMNSTSTYKDTIVGLIGISRELNQASRRLSHLLQKILETFSEIEAFCVRVIAILDDRDDDNIATAQ